MRTILIHFPDSGIPVFQFIGDSDSEVAFLRAWVDSNLNGRAEGPIPRRPPQILIPRPEVRVEGYIRLYRKLLQHSVFTTKDEKLFRIFIYCLLRASHKETVVYFNHQDIPLKPGEFITSREHAARDLGYGPKTFDRKIDDLQKLGILTRSTTRRFSIISITNWSCYQNLPENNGPVPDPGNDPLADHKQEERKKKNTLCGAPDPRVKDFISFWFGVFKEKFGAPYMVNGGKEGALVKRLLTLHSLEKLQDLAALFFTSDDPFIQNSGYTIGAFSAQINKLATLAMRKPKW